MRAFITVIGKDTVGILAKVSSACAEENISVSEVTQSVLQEMFVMIMLVEMSNSKKTIAKIKKVSVKKVLYSRFTVFSGFEFKSGINFENTATVAL